MTISRAVRGTLTGVAAALIALTPIAVTPALAAPHLPVLQSPKGVSLNLPDAPNARDLSGIPTQGGGGKVKDGSVFRADALNKLSDAEQQQLVSAGIAEIIDFRSPTERGQNPDKIPASIPEKSLPVYDPNNDFYLFFAKAVQGGPAVQQQLLGDGKAKQFMVDYYRWMVTDATARSQFSAALQDIATANGPVLFHCTAGKDRTGWMSAILLSALNAPKGQIYNNYLKSNDTLAASNKATLDGLVAKGLVTDPSLFTPILGVDRDYLDASFDAVAQTFGSFDNFLSQGLGIDDATVATLKSKLVGK
ncbi:tyrosine-protein phosphatase [Nocardia sp. CDC153]|uniref:tyrosine-protein phosphatase n=1 Tax=Nocardia sp. CDC153 TaxID=3112167 RepID=UPI002DBD767E|nr:tyrosine-protein phosphatase [Nocardia sp. CDC153]MEC3957272.1 tyrosine-protein phosphatase [Nocardia sp. CDC153]